MKINEFKGSFNWVYKFMKRNNLSMITKTETGQKLPNDWELKQSNTDESDDLFFDCFE